MYFGEFTIEKSQYDFRSKNYIVIASNGYYRKKVEVSPTERESGGLPVIKEMEELNENVVEKHDFNNLDMNNWGFVGHVNNLHARILPILK